MSGTELVLVASFAMLGAVLTVGCGKSTKTTAATSTTTTTPVNQGAAVQISEYQFAAPTVTIKAGQAVVWKNVGNVQHTVTETSSPRTFNSPDINPDQTFTETFNKPGTHNYICSIHPDRMHGTVIVQAAG